MLNFVKYFFNICWDGLLGFIVHFVNLVNHWFTDVEPPLCLWNKSNLIMMYDPLPALLNFVSKIFFWGFLHLCSLGILACNFLVAISSGFHIKVIAGFVKKKKKKQNKTKPKQFVEKFENSYYYFFFECLVEFINEATWSQAFIEKLLIVDSISLLVISSDSLQFSIDRLYVSRNLSSRCHIC